MHGSLAGNDTGIAGPDALGWTAIQIAQQITTAGQDKVAMVQLPTLDAADYYAHKFPVAQRAFNVTRKLVYHDETIDTSTPTLVGVTHNSDDRFSVDLHFKNTAGLHLKPVYHCDTHYTRWRNKTSHKAQSGYVPP